VSGLDGYERRIGRYGPELARGLLAVAGARAGLRALDVGCGSGALTVPLAEVVGEGNVAAIDSDPEAVALCAKRLPAAEVRVAHAEALPYDDDSFDIVLEQLVMGLVDDSEHAAKEMTRVARPAAPVATCVWDFAGGMTLLRCFWDAARAVAPDLAARHDQALTHAHSTREGLETLWHAAGLARVTTGELSAGADYRDFADLWEPLAIPDGSPGRFLAALAADAQDKVRAWLYARLGEPTGAFRLTARAWYALGYA
jgi:SAM-dependent methyltransferase